MLWGLNLYENSPVIVNLWGKPEIKNPNLGVIASPGAGKSFLLKILVLRHLFEGVRVVIGDPEDEYSRLAEAAGGRNISLSASSSIGFNLFELPSMLDGSLVIDDEGGEEGEAKKTNQTAGNNNNNEDKTKVTTTGRKAADPLTEKAATLIPLLCMMIQGADVDTVKGDGAGSLKRQTRDRLAKAVFETYRRCGITREDILAGRLNAREINRNTELYARLLDQHGGPEYNSFVARRFGQPGGGTTRANHQPR